MIENDSQLPNCIFVFILHALHKSTYDEESMVSSASFLTSRPNKRVLEPRRDEGSVDSMDSMMVFTKKSYLDVLRICSTAGAYRVVGAGFRWGEKNGAQKNKGPMSLHLKR